MKFVYILLFTQTVKSVFYTEHRENLFTTGDIVSEQNADSRLHCMQLCHRIDPTAGVLFEVPTCKCLLMNEDNQNNAIKLTGVYERQLEKKVKVHGGFTQWSRTGSCSTTCGTGHQTEVRTCTNPAPKYGGLDCVGVRTRTLACNPKECPVHGGFTSWTRLACTQTCNGGQLTETRTCTQPTPKNGGDDCKGPATQTLACNTQACPECDATDGSYPKADPNDSTKFYVCGSGKIYHRLCPAGLEYQAQLKICNWPTTIG